MFDSQEVTNEIVSPHAARRITDQAPRIAKKPDRLSVTQLPTLKRQRPVPTKEKFDLDTCKIGNGPDALNPQQYTFVKILCSFEDPYLFANQTKAALAAKYGNGGMNENSAGVQATRLMAMHKIQEAIRTELNKRLKQYDITAEWVLQRLAWTADCNYQDFLNPDGTLKNVRALPRDVAHNIQKVKCTVTRNPDGSETVDQEIELANAQARNQAKRLLGMHKGLFTEKFEFVPGDLQQAQDVRAQAMRAKLLEELGPEETGDEE